MKPPRKLRARDRVLCLLGPGGAAAVFLIARLILPLAWSEPRLSAWVHRPCLLKVSTGVPCPLCGATRSTVLAAHGEWSASLVTSLAGVVLILAGPLIGLWLGLCALTGGDLGLSAVGRYLKELGIIYIVSLSFLGVWAYKILLDCVLRAGGG